MTQDRADSSEWRARAAELTEELRAVVEALAVLEPGTDQLVAACELARKIRSRLEAPARPRWYETYADIGAIGPEAGSVYLDQSPVRGRLNPLAPPLSIEVIEREDGTRILRGHARLGRVYEGPPHGVHGGWVAALFDDLLGASQGLAEAPGVTATLRVRYREVTPLDEELRLEAWIHRDSGRRIVARGTCHAGDTLTADAEALFIRVDFDEMQERMEERREGRS